MRVLIYFESADSIKRSGIGRAMRHQLTALRYAGVETVTRPSEGAFDIAHINTYWPKSWKLLKKCRKAGIPVIVHGHSTYEDFQNSFRLWRLIYPLYRLCLRHMYSRADRIIAPTPYARDLIASYPFVKCPVTSVSNGIDISEYREDTEAQRLFRERFCIGKDVPFVMGVGFPFERKGIQDFFELARRFPQVKFIWFGSLERILTSTKVLKWIRQKPENVLMPGYVAGEVIRGAFQCAKALLFLSLEETEGIVVLEALASGCPVICRNIGVYKEWLSDGFNAHIGGNVDDFEKILSDLLENGERQEILVNGFRTAQERDLPRIGEELKQNYEELLEMN